MGLSPQRITKRPGKSLLSIATIAAASVLLAMGGCSPQPQGSSGEQEVVSNEDFD